MVRGAVGRMAQQSTKPGTFVGLYRAQGLALNGQYVAGHQDFLGAPVGDHSMAVVVHQHDTPGQMVQSVESRVPLGLQLGQAVLHP